MTRSIYVHGLVASMIALVVACSSNDGGSSSSSPGGGAPTSSGGTGGGSSSGGFKSCPDSSQSSCTEAELKPYNDCILQKCEPAFKKCYGDGFQTGNFSGPCGTFMACVQKCACGDTACLSACTPDDACQACSQEVGTCGESCTEPACASGGTSSGGTSSSGGTPNATCADLETCCNEISDADQKQGCIDAKNAANGNDATCASYYGAFKNAGMCS